MPRNLSAEEAKDLLIYDAETGRITWRFARGRCAAGSEAGCDSGRGYRLIRVLGSMYYAHRIAFLMAHGRMPLEVDHINGIRSDNRIANLREVTRSENQKNKAISSANTSGKTGVFWNTGKHAWTARIKVNGKTYHVGDFHDFQKAVEARKIAETELGFHENHGRPLHAERAAA